MSNNWWADKLSGQPASAPRTSAPTGPVPNVRYVPEGNVTATPVQYDSNQDQLVTKAQSARLEDTCPGCYSGNYFAPTGTQMKRCYDCGYPILQAGSGAGMPSGAGQAATPARQVSTANNFNPTTIVDRIG